MAERLTARAVVIESYDAGTNGLEPLLRFAFALGTNIKTLLINR
jgi:hypothetical protein